MLRDIKKCSAPELSALFNSSDPQKHCVIWIRNFEMTQQIFMSDGYEHIWQRQQQELYESPMMWFDFLASENKLDYMKQLERRHNQGYRDADKNGVWYQIDRPNHTRAYIQCVCYKCVNPRNEYFVVGFAQALDLDTWQQAYTTQNLHVTKEFEVIKEKTFTTLKKQFGITVCDTIDTKQDGLDKFIDNIAFSKQEKFSQREIECVYHLCQGKTAKQIARSLNLSSRTVESHLDNVRNKINCANKLELISQFMPLLPTKV